MKRSTHDRSARGALAVAGALAAAPAGVAQAADWYWSPTVSVGGEYNDNPSLSSRTDNTNSVTGALAEASLRLGYLAETSSGWIEPRLRTRRYADEEALDSDDQFLDFRADGEGQFTRWGIRGDLAREQVRTAELDEVNLDPDAPDIPSDDAGFVEIRARRERARLFPFVEWTLSPVSSLRARANLIDTSYDEDTGSLQDFTNINGELTYRRAASDVTDWLVLGAAGDYSSDREGRDYNAYSGRVGFERELSQTTRLRALAGVANSSPDQGSSQTDGVGEIFLTRRLETTWLRAGYRRSLTGSGLGAAIRDEVQVGFTRDLTQLISAGLGFRAYSSSALTDDSSDRDYAQVRAEFTWRLSQSWFFNADYRFTFLDRQDDPETADANQLFLFLSWSPPKPTR